MGDSVSYYQAAFDAASQYGVPPQLFSDVIQQESGYNSSAYNPLSGASGIAQILPSTAADPGYGISPVNPFNPNASLNFAAQYLNALFNKLGSWGAALNAYSGTPQGSTPYPGNTAILNDLQNLTGSGNATAATAPPPPGSQSTPNSEASSQSSGCTGWITTPVACITATLTELGFVLLALVVIAGGLFLLKDKAQ